MNKEKEELKKLSDGWLMITLKECQEDILRSKANILVEQGIINSSERMIEVIKEIFKERKEVE